ncbi:hypothetical protein OFN28_29140, partial [Escherichia coli]|nr:hypothetical protein [Escherichia coli]
LKPTDRLSVEINVDYLRDNLPNYYGTPLVPASFARDPIGGLLNAPGGYVVDRDMRFKQYNVGDSRRSSWQVWPRIVLNWTPTDAITVSNT